MNRMMILLVASGPIMVLPSPTPGQEERTLNLELIAHIDPDTGPGPAPPFGRIAALELGSDGSIFVLDALTRTVSVFGADGRFRHSFGRRGQGPGEMEDPIALFWGPAGHLWVADARFGRFTLFAPNGEVVGTRRAVGPRPLAPPRFGFSDSGHLVTVGLDFEGGSLERPNAVFVEAEVGEEAVRQVRQLPLPFVQWPEVYDFSGADVTLMILVPFSPEPQFGIDPAGRLWVADAMDGTVHRWAEPEGWDLSVGRESEPVPVRDVDIEEAISESRDAEELRALAGDAGVQRFVARIPQVKPLVTSVFFDDHGRVWVMRSPVAQNTTHPTEVYELDGTLRAKGGLGLAPRPHPKVRAGLLVGVARDEYGRESVMVYRLARD